jgi:hypothetical protein
MSVSFSFRLVLYSRVSDCLGSRTVMNVCYVSECEEELDSRQFDTDLQYHQAELTRRAGSYIWLITWAVNLIYDDYVDDIFRIIKGGAPYVLQEGFVRYPDWQVPGKDIRTLLLTMQLWDDTCMWHNNINCMWRWLCGNYCKQLEQGSVAESTFRLEECNIKVQHTEHHDYSYVRTNSVCWLWYIWLISSLRTK